MKKIFTFLLLCSLFSVQSIAQQWSLLGAKAFSDGEAFSKQILIDNDLVQNEMIQIYPNPNHGFFTIKIPQVVDKNHSVEIINLAGQTVYSEFLTNKNIHQINLNGKPNGIYLVKIKLGTEIFQKKIIVR